MKLSKIEIGMQVVVSNSPHASIYRVVSRVDDSHRVEIVEEGTNNNSRWIDVSILEKASKEQLINAGE